MESNSFLTFLKACLFIITAIFISISSAFTLESCAFVIVKKGGTNWILIPMALAMVLGVGWFVANKISYLLLSLVFYKSYGKWAFIICLVAISIFRLVVILISYDFEKSRNLIALLLYLGFSLFILKGFIDGTTLTTKEYLKSFSLRKKKPKT